MLGRGNSNPIDGNMSDFDRSNHSTNNTSTLDRQASNQGSVGSRGRLGAANNNNDLSRQFNNLDVKSPLEIRKNSPLVSSAIGTTFDNNYLKRSSTFLAEETHQQNYPYLGLQNRQYYTCFMNSILQCLIATPNFL